MPNEYDDIKLIEFSNRADQIANIEDPHQRIKDLSTLTLEVLDYKDWVEDWGTYDKLVVNKIGTIRKMAEQEVREETGEPELDLSDVYSIGDWIKWKGTNLCDVDISVLLSNLEEIDSKQYMKYRKILSKEESKELKKLVSKLEKSAFEKYGIDKNKLSDPSLWRARGVEHVDGYPTIGFYKLINWRENEDAEGTIIQIFVDTDGIRILAEVADPMPIDMQKKILNDMIQDVSEQFPDSFNKEIIFIEGGDFKDILSGRLDRNIVVYRMMSDIQYENWLRGEVIEKGTYFADQRRFAVGTDFAGEGFKDVFAFNVNRALMSGADEHVLMNDIPLVLQNGILIKAKL